MPIYKAILKYGHSNFIFDIIEYCESSNAVEREQYFLDMIFSNKSYLKLNLSPNAGTTLGLKHSEQFKLNRTGILNPMFGKKFSSEFLENQIKDKTGINNSMFGKKKSSETLAKLYKLVYVYEFETKNFIGAYPTVKCSKEFKMGKNTLTKYLNNGLPFKNKLFSRFKLH